VGDSHRLAGLAVPVEGRRLDPPGHRQVVGGRPEVLADGHDVDADGPQVRQRRHHLVVGLAHPHDQARLCHQSGLLGPGQHRQAAGITGRRAHRALQAGNGLDVVVEHVGPGRRDRGQ
jgi:hypothetical protein